MKNKYLTLGFVLCYVGMPYFVGFSCGPSCAKPLENKKAERKKPMLDLDVSTNKFVYTQAEELRGVVELINNTATPFEIAYQCGPLQYLTIVVYDKNNKALVSRRLGDIQSPLDEEIEMVIKPMSKKRFDNIFLLDLKKLEPGNYTLGAFYEYQRLRLESNRFEISVKPSQEKD